MMIRNDGKEAASLRKELKDYETAGTHLYLDGRPCRAEAIVRACLAAEDPGYMRDFISDDREHITDINFVRIRTDRPLRERKNFKKG